MCIKKENWRGRIWFKKGGQKSERKTKENFDISLDCNVPIGVEYLLRVQTSPASNRSLGLRMNNCIILVLNGLNMKIKVLTMIVT